MTTQKMDDEIVHGVSILLQCKLQKILLLYLKKKFLLLKTTTLTRVAEIIIKDVNKMMLFF